MFVYVLLKFDLLIIFFLEEPAKKVKNYQLFFFSHLFQRGFLNLTTVHAQFYNQVEFSAHAEILTEWKATLKNLSFTLSAHS